MQIPLPIAVHTLVTNQPSSLLWMMLTVLDQRLHSSHAPTPPVTTVHMLKMLAFNVCPVSVLLLYFQFCYIYKNVGACVCVRACHFLLQAVCMEPCEFPSFFQVAHMAQ